MIRKAIASACWTASALAGAVPGYAQSAAPEPQPPLQPLVAPLPPPVPLPEVPEPDLAGPFAPGLRPRPLAPESWITAGDYPLSALREGRQGKTGVRLSIAATGRLDSCEVIGPSGHADLDAATCPTLIRRARFQPATDAQGKLIAAVYTVRIGWALPEEEEVAPAG